MRAKVTGWATFLGCLFLLSFAAATPYSKSADLALISVRLSIVVVLSVLLLRERWGHRDDVRQRSEDGSGANHGMLQRFRRWYYDEQKPSS